MMLSMTLVYTDSPSGNLVNYNWILPSPGLQRCSVDMYCSGISVISTDDQSILSCLILMYKFNYLKFSYCDACNIDLYPLL